MKYTILTLLVLFVSIIQVPAQSTKSVYDFTVTNIDGETISLDQYRGKVLMIVNVASKCGYTYQYEGLENLYKKYSGEDFLILGFPTNDFLWQEPGTDEEIKTFCSVNFGVTFPMFSKISVTGRDREPLYDFLIESEADPRFSGRITWNFNKFLIDREGNIAGRFDSKIEPESEEVIKALEELL